MKLFIASDYKGYNMKIKIFEILDSINSCEIFDCGSCMEDSYNFINFAKLVCDRIINQNKCGIEKSFGILICDSGACMSIIANRYRNIRCCLAYNKQEVIQARKNDNCNVIALSSDNFDMVSNMEFVKDFILTEYEKNDINQKRIDMLELI